MSFWDRLRTLLKREQRELDDMVADANAAMDRKEREMAATPEEKLAIEQRRAEQADAEFERLRQKIDGEG
jgi:hypothetical protein